MLKGSELSAMLILLVVLAPISTQAYVETVDVGRGDVVVHVPDNPSFDPTQPAPLLMLLHGDGGTGASYENYYQFQPMADSNNFLYTYPDGRVIPGYGATGWDMIDPDFNEDSEYLSDLIDAIDEIVVDHQGNDVELTIDPKRVYVVGRSSGGAMALRMACDKTTRITAAMSISGLMYIEEHADDDPATGEDYCQPQQPVRIAIVHGTNDLAADYNGGVLPPPYNEPYASAPDAAKIWRNINECNEGGASVVQKDLVPDIAGRETTITFYPSGCHTNGSSEFWMVQDAYHGIAWDLDALRNEVFAFFNRYERQSMVFQDQDTLVWPAAPDTLSYDISRGILDLSVQGFVDNDGDGLNDGGYGSCLTDPTEVVGTTFVDTLQPLPGELVYYVRGRTDDRPPLQGGRQPGQYGMTSAGKDRQNNCPPPTSRTRF